jgi:hypothetical protein
MKLEWIKLPDGGELAAGQDWTYLITLDGKGTMAALTRWETGPGAMHIDIARQAALHAIRYGGVFTAGAEATETTLAHLRRSAQEYESGLDVIGQPAWWHGHAPAAAIPEKEA